MIEIEPPRLEPLAIDPREGTVQAPSVRPVGRARLWSRRRHLEWFWQHLRFRAPLVAVDLGVACIVLVLVAKALELFGLSLAPSRQFALLGLQSLILFSTFFALRLYRSVGLHPVRELERVVTATLMTYLIMIAVVVWRFDGQVLSELIVFSIAGLISIILLPSLRHLARCQLGRTRWWPQPLIIIGQSEMAYRMIEEMEREKHLGWRPIGFVREADGDRKSITRSRYCLGDEDELPEIADRDEVFWGMIDGQAFDSRETQGFIDRYQHVLPNIISVVGQTDWSSFARGIDCGRAAGICYQASLPLFAPRVLKRAFDIVASGIAIILFSPLFLMIAIAIRLGGRGPIFFSQERIGLNSTPFKMWKFRSMVPDADKVLQNCLLKDPKLMAEWKQTKKLTSDPRITRVGKLLRKTSLDELPQLWNVFNGTMSMVGPRPIERLEIENYGHIFWLYQRTKPGITGLWQVNGRNLTSYQTRLEYVSFYVRNWSIWLDWYILLKTIRVVLLCEGAY